MVGIPRACRTRTGFVFLAVVRDGYSRRIVGWRTSNSVHTDSTLEQAVDGRRTVPRGTELARPQSRSLRLRLPGIGAGVQRLP